MTYRCDICSRDIEEKLDGHFYDQNRVLTSPGYWLHLYTKSNTKLEEAGIGGYLAMFCRDNSGFTVCDHCYTMLNSDTALSEDYGISTYVTSQPSGQVDSYAAGKVAGTVWQQLHGDWPKTVELGGGGETGTLRLGETEQKIGFFRKLFGSKKKTSEQGHSDSIETVCDDLMKKHMRATGGVLSSIAMTADDLMKLHGVAPDDAQAAIEKWLSDNGP
tara:strand:+ start:55423 stop:56073 length:651 start_codon:yes stop_codon:yes gene_type:complete